MPSCARACAACTAAKKARFGESSGKGTAAKQAKQLHGGDDLKGAYLALATKLLPMNSAILIDKALAMELADSKRAREDAAHEQQIWQAGVRAGRWTCG